MIIRKDVIDLVKDNHHSDEQFPALFRALAHGQIVRHHFELRCQTPKPLRSVRHGKVIIPRVSASSASGVRCILNQWRAVPMWPGCLRPCGAVPGDPSNLTYFCSSMLCGSLTAISGALRYSVIVPVTHICFPRYCSSGAPNFSRFIPHIKTVKTRFG